MKNPMRYFPIGFFLCYNTFMKTNKILSLILKIFGISLLSIISIVFLAWLGLNVFKHIHYKDYFSALDKVAKNPGLRDDFVPQGITSYDDFFVTVGYMLTGENSRIYIVDKTSGKTKYFTLLSDGKNFTGHTGGLQYLNGFFYLANEGNSLYKFPAEVIYESENNIEIGSPVKMNNNTSFVFAKGNYLYVGEFHKEVNYPCNNIISFGDKTHNAIVSKYDIADLTKPVAIYSIPEMIQGFCIKDDGTIILSSSWGLNSSNFYIYSPEKIAKTDIFYDDAPVYFLTEPSKIVKAPAMSEDLDIVKISDGSEKIVTMFESASNKYLYGKFFFANYIAGLDF